MATWAILGANRGMCPGAVPTNTLVTYVAINTVVTYPGTNTLVTYDEETW